MWINVWNVVRVWENLLWSGNTVKTCDYYLWTKGFKTFCYYHVTSGFSTSVKSYLKHCLPTLMEFVGNRLELHAWEQRIAMFFHLFLPLHLPWLKSPWGKEVVLVLYFGNFTHLSFHYRGKTNKAFLYWLGKMSYPAVWAILSIFVKAHTHI